MHRCFRFSLKIENEKCHTNIHFYIFTENQVKNGLKSTEMQTPPSDRLHARRDYRFAVISHEMYNVKP